MAWLLDNNVISEFRKPQAEPKVLAFLSSSPLSDLYVSVVTLQRRRLFVGNLNPDHRRFSFSHQPTQLLDFLLTWRPL